MKKTLSIKIILILLMALMLVFSLCGCNGDNAKITEIFKTNEKNEGNAGGVKDETLSQVKQTEIEQAHAKMRAEQYDGYSCQSKVMHYYGEYNGAYVVYMIDGLAYTCAITGEAVSGVRFTYPSSNTLWVYVAGKGFFRLQQAHKKGYLSQNDLSQIAKKHKEFFAYLYN